jgi:hypothetical protein
MVRLRWTNLCDLRASALNIFQRRGAKELHICNWLDENFIFLILGVNSTYSPMHPAATKPSQLKKYPKIRC